MIYVNSVFVPTKLQCFERPLVHDCSRDNDESRPLAKCLKGGESDRCLSAAYWSTAQDIDSSVPPPNNALNRFYLVLREHCLRHRFLNMTPTWI